MFSYIYIHLHFNVVFVAGAMTVRSSVVMKNSTLSTGYVHNSLKTEKPIYTGTSPKVTASR